MRKERYIALNLLVLLIAILFIIGCMENTQNNNEKENEEVTVLTVIFGDEQIKYTLGELETLESYLGTGRFIKTKLLPDSVVISESHEYTGIHINTLLDQLSDLPDDYNVSVISDDGWIVTYTMDEISGNVDVYDETGDIISNETAIMLLAYKEDGKYYTEIEDGDEIGPLRIAFVGNDVITSSNLWSKMVVEIKITAL